MIIIPQGPSSGPDHIGWPRPFLMCRKPLSKRRRKLVAQKDRLPQYELMSPVKKRKRQQDIYFSPNRRLGGLLFTFEWNCLCQMCCFPLWVSIDLLVPRVQKIKIRKLALTDFHKTFYQRQQTFDQSHFGPKSTIFWPKSANFWPKSTIFLPKSTNFWPKGTFLTKIISSAPALDFWKKKFSYSCRWKLRQRHSGPAARLLRRQKLRDGRRL